jgi:hypothetical protein
MTLVVSLPLLARWSEPRRRAVISEILGRLDRAAIPYKLIQISAGGVLYLPKTSGKADRPRERVGTATGCEAALRTAGCRRPDHARRWRLTGSRVL